MKDVDIKLKNLRFYAYHGVQVGERLLGNEFHVNLVVTIPFNQKMEEDELENTVSYEDLFTIVKEEMATPRKLLEKVAIRIVMRIRKEFPQILKGSLEIEKVHAPIRDMLGSASVTMNF